jgi:hypothetical protein
MVGRTNKDFRRPVDFGTDMPSKPLHLRLPKRLAIAIGGNLGLVTGLLMLTSILLIGFAPVARLFSQSTASVAWMGTLHLPFWFISTLFGLRFLESSFLHSKTRSAAGLRTWIVIFILVVLQMSAALRPLVGTSNSFLPTERIFFMSHWAKCLR